MDRDSAAPAPGLEELATVCCVEETLSFLGVGLSCPMPIEDLLIGVTQGDQLVQIRALIRAFHFEPTGRIRGQRMM
jgi:hypothetical protein